MEYWDDADIAEAKANGIGYNNFYARVYHYGWSVERAKTEPIISRSDIKRKYPAELIALAKENGINRNVFYKRVNESGYSPQRAATEPIPKRTKYPDHILELMEKTGVPRRYFYRRVAKGWSIKEAAGTPVMTKSEAGKMAAQKRRERFS